MKSVFVLSAALAGALCLGACSTAERAGATVALPFAAIGDTVMTPFQGMGKASEFLIEEGDEHVAKVNEEKKGNITREVARDTSVVLYAPGYALYPFQWATPDEWYPMTKACLEAMQPPAEEGEDEEIDATPAPAPSEEFIEF